MNTKVGTSINFYSIQFYNQQLSKYNSYSELFIASTGTYTGTAVTELMRRGVDQKKIVIAKPIAPSDITGTGWIDAS